MIIICAHLISSVFLPLRLPYTAELCEVPKASMASIFGTDGFFNANKVQNQSAIPHYTNFEGVLAVNGVSVVANGLSVTQVSDQAQVLAPAGQRDLWAASSGSNPIATAPHQDPYKGNLIVVGPNGAPWLQYSTDGGATFTDCKFDFAPTDYVTVGFGPALSVGLSNAGESFTSPDNINWTRTATGLSIKPNSFNIGYFPAAALFVVSDYNQPTLTIATSADGITWTSRANTTLIDVFGDPPAGVAVMPAVLGVAPFSMYSTDGITWQAGSGLAANTRAIAYSSDKRQWMAITFVTGVIYTSTDGHTWTAGLTGGPTSVSALGLIWVSNYGRWYAGTQDTSGNFSLWQTTDATLPFIGTHLDGAVIPPSGLQDSAISYNPTLDRFFITLYVGTPYGYYSTARPRDIKALSDNIRVRGFPLMCAMYSTGSATTVNNTAVETVVSAPSDHIGSLILQAGQSVGATVRFQIQTTYTTATTGVTWRLKVNGVTKGTLASAMATGTNACNTLDFTVVVQAANIMVTMTDLWATVSNATVAYNPAIANTFSITAQWGDALSQLSVDQITATVAFLNGA